MEGIRVSQKPGRTK